MNRRRFPSLFCHAVALALIAVFGCWRTSAHAQGVSGELPEKARIEIEYIKELQELGLPDYADIVIAKVEAEFGKEVKYAIEVLKMSGLLQLGKFEEVKKVIASKPDQNGELVWALKLALADGHYAWGQYKEAQELYNAFFAAFPNGPPAALKRFYIDAAFKYAQMLLLMGNPAGALTAFDNVLKAKPAKNVARQIQGETAELLVKLAEDSQGAERKQYMERAEKLCTEILWVQDLWFGKAIVYLAHIKQLRGDIKGAKALIDEYTPQLRQIDESLKQQSEETGDDLTRLNPMAECRYLIAVMMDEEAVRLLKEGKKQEALDLWIGEKLASGERATGAYQHFINVFIRYPATKWAPDAGVRGSRIEESLAKDFGVKIEKKVTPKMMADVERYQFQSARVLYNQKNWQEAADSYVTVLNLFGQSTAAISALGDLAHCYLELKEELYAEMVVRFIGERFGRRRELMGDAGNQMLRLADEAADDFNLPLLRDRIHNAYFDLVKGHSRAPDLLYRFGEKKVEAGDLPAARSYFDRIIKNYTNALVYLPAHSMLAATWEKANDQTNALAVLEQYLQKLEKTTNPGAPGILTRLRIAGTHKAFGGNDMLQNAIKVYSEVVQLVKSDDKRYFKNQEERAHNRVNMEAAIFFKALCLTMLTEPADQANAFKEKAIGDYRMLLQEFPKSQYAAAALSRVGVLWTLLGNAQEAEKALRELEEKYPDTEEAKNSKFMLAKSLLELKKRDQAIAVFKEMFGAGSGKFSGSQMLTAGRELLIANEYEIAMQAFDQALVKANGVRNVEEPALLGKGKCLTELKRYAEGGKILTQMLAKFEKSGYTVEACLNLSRCTAELASEEKDAAKRRAMFDDSVKAMQRVLKYDSTPARRTEVAVAVGKINERKAKAEAANNQTDAGKAKAREYLNDAIASYLTMLQMTDANAPGVTPHLQDAYAACVPLLLETVDQGKERVEMAIEECDAYIQRYPEGKYITEIRRWRSQAMIKATQLGIVGAGQVKEKEAAPAAGTAPVATPAPAVAPAAAGTNPPAAKP